MKLQRERDAMDNRMTTKISEQFTILPKSKIKAGQGLDNGKYPFYTSSDTKISYLDTYEYDDEIVILGTGGKPSCNYVKGKFSFSTDNFALKTKGNVKPKYLYYFLRNNNLSILENGFHGAGLKHIGKEYMLNIQLPLEHIEKQNKIIKILDFITRAKQNAMDRFFQLDELVKSRFISQEVA
jgi:type I restriction enzyme S subunit